VDQRKAVYVDDREVSPNMSPMFDRGSLSIGKIDPRRSESLPKHKRSSKQRSFGTLIPSATAEHANQRKKTK
jgi:hypothetical protein